MTQTINIRDIYPIDQLYVRSRVAELKDCINDTSEEVVLDFEGITFMSRSFADELFNLMENYKSIRFVCEHRTEVVKVMMEKVAQGRSQERSRGISHPQFIEVDTYEALSAYLASHPC